jgi:hypothetical protein
LSALRAAIASERRVERPQAAADAEPDEERERRQREQQHLAHPSGEVIGRMLADGERLEHRHLVLALRVACGVASPRATVDHARRVAVCRRSRRRRSAGAREQQRAVIAPDLERERPRTPVAVVAIVVAVTAIAAVAGAGCIALDESRQPLQVEHQERARTLLQARVGKLVDLLSRLAVARNEHRTPDDDEAAEHEEEQATANREASHPVSLGMR